MMSRCLSGCKVLLVFLAICNMNFFFGKTLKKLTFVSNMCYTKKYRIRIFESKARCLCVIKMEDEMARVVSIGAQNFEVLIKNNYFYVDKTAFIKEWWENGDSVTLISRPRRFGKTLNMSMLERFFSVKYAGQDEVFQNLSIWKEEKYRELQGTYPVLFLSFASVKADNFVEAKEQIFQVITDLYSEYEYLRDSDTMGERDREFFDRVGRDMSNSDAARALHQLAGNLEQYYGKKVIILLDEYDTPLQEAYVGGYWKEIVSFTRNLFNATFKTNPHLERALMTGITRVSKESLFSDLNNLKVVTMTSNNYASCFGFTEEEVFAAMDEFGMTNKDEVKRWYDGFIIGNLHDIYNPWSIINLLDEKKLKAYWANTSSNALVGNLLLNGDINLKMHFEELLHRHSIVSEIDEEIVFDQLGQNENEIWSLLLASGYLTVLNVDDDEYELTLTNYEVEKMFNKMVKAWFKRDQVNYNGFIQALLRGDLKEMNAYMKRFALTMFSFFDGGNHPSETTSPERFYHGFVLGLLVELAGRYEVTSNRESGFGRYDVMLSPNDLKDDAIILEFKVHDSEEESSMDETVQSALNQIEEKKYEQTLLARGVSKEKIRKYGFAFRGKEVKIG